MGRGVRHGGAVRSEATLRLINNHAGTSKRSSHLYFREPDPEKRRSAVWNSLDRTFSLPQTRSDDVSDYIPTQIVAELFRSNRYDGIIYRSAFDQTSHNVCLFYLNAAEPTGATLYEIRSMEIKPERIG